VNASQNDVSRQQLAALVRAVTLFASEIAFAGLFAYVIYETWEAKSGKPPDISNPVEGAAAALAVALAAGYAGALGVQPQPGTRAIAWFSKWPSLTDVLLFLGVFLYMFVGAACGLTYLANVEEAPGLLKTVAIAFGGYVIAYIGAAYRQLSQ
jgi:hypothetical protein